MGYRNLEPKFYIGLIYKSKEVHRLQLEVEDYIKRHQSGDWGDVAPEQVRMNENGILDGTLILSRFHVEASDGCQYRLIVLTEDDRGRTVVMLDYEFDSKLKRPSPGNQGNSGDAGNPGTPPA